MRQNKYDPHRANLVICNWQKKSAVEVDLSKPTTTASKKERLVKLGDKYRVQDPHDFFGKPVASGIYQGKSIKVPMKNEFGAFVLVIDD